MGFGSKSLLALAQDYLDFLLTREEKVMKKHLSLDFVKRSRVTNQLKLIKKLPHLCYGPFPETQLWEAYPLQKEGEDFCITPFQFHILCKNENNPLRIEIMTVTLHKIVFEKKNWKITAVISEAEENLLEKISSSSEIKEYQALHD